MINLSYLYDNITKTINKTITQTITQEMKYGFYTLGIFTVMQTVTFAFYIYKRDFKIIKKDSEQKVVEKESDVVEKESNKVEENKVVESENEVVEKEQLDKKETLMLLKKHKDALIILNDTITKIQTEILILRDKLSDPNNVDDQTPS